MRSCVACGLWMPLHHAWLILAYLRARTKVLYLTSTEIHEYLYRIGYEGDSFIDDDEATLREASRDKLMEAAARELAFAIHMRLPARA